MGCDVLTTLRLEQECSGVKLILSIPAMPTPLLAYCAYIVLNRRDLHIEQIRKNCFMHRFVTDL
jgi:hypothetical protein